MATTLQLERIGALVDKLDPLDAKQRGMRIQADEWNALVDVLRGVLEIDRTQEDGVQTNLARAFAAIDHQHLGQVSLSWLDADLQARVGGAQDGGSVSVRAALSEAAQTLAGLGTQVARLGDLVQRQQTALDRITVDSADRSRTLDQFDQRFAGVENLRTLVGTLSNDVRGVAGNIDTVLALRGQLTDPAGHPIDVAQLKANVTELEGLRENLKGVDGSLLRLRDIEVKLNEVRDATGVGGAGGLDGRIATTVDGMRVQLVAGEEARDAALRQSMATDIGVSETRLRNELNGNLDARSATFNQAITTEIAAAQARDRVDVDQRIAASAADVTRAAGESSAALLDQRLAGLPDQVRATTLELVNGVRAELNGEITASVGGALNARFDTLQQTVGARVGALEGRMGDLTSRLPTLVADSVATLRDQLAVTVSEQVGSSIAAMRGELNGSISEQIKAGIAVEQSDANGRIDARFAGLDALVAASVDRSVAASTRDLPDRIAGEVRTQIGGLDVGGLIRNANAELATQLRAEQAQGLADQQTRSSTALSSTVTLLRGEIGATRTELNTAINTRVVAGPRITAPIVGPVR